jgi:hypothetical protein
MKDVKNYIIALLAGLLVLTLSVQYFSRPTVKTYDEVKVVQYDRCLDYLVTNLQGRDLFVANKNEGLFDPYLGACARYKP